jgi:hypothetical protein
MWNTFGEKQSVGTLMHTGESASICYAKRVTRNQLRPLTAGSKPEYRQLQ